MTRAERLAQKEANDKKKLADSRKKLAETQAELREETRKTVHKRRYRVGALAQEAGLFVLDDTTLAGLFALLARLPQVPNPVAVLEALLCDSVSPALVAVDGRAEALPRVSTPC
jgi:hypothetical protein